MYLCIQAVRVVGFDCRQEDGRCCSAAVILSSAEAICSAPKLVEESRVPACFRGKLEIGVVW